ncbi:hypothetical protein N7499_002824 [Penicillium canescens]|nr:hypothetical protein N7499_002824 [Penicillium canescens]KAJ6166439.1 hypothetical protein N7485_009683 [Penicillium canescens]
MTEGSDVNDFLERIRELGERRDKEDEERTKKLEEEILQGRKERQARRAERARSLALTDDSPTLNVARLSASSISPGSINPPEHLEPTPRQETQDMDKSENTASAEGRGSVQDPMDSPRSRPPLSRSRAGTLSWQQRPLSREFGSPTASPTRSPTRASHLRNLSTASDENRLSRPFAFARPTDSSPQSPERGVGSAYRKKEERPDSVTESSAPQLPTPSVDHEPSVEVEKPEAERSPSIPRTGSRDSNTSHRFSVSSVSGLGSPVHLSEAQKLEPLQAESYLEDPMPESPTQRRMSPERTRSTSPTKGLGGFVQSAMMRRSDSVSKRWSAQIPQGLSRSNSIISNRSSVAGPSLSEMAPPSTRGVGRETPTLPRRPGSSHSEAPTERTERPTTPSGPPPALSDRNNVRADGSPSRTSRPLHSRSASSVTADGNDSPFVSRTMDPRRWSPSKATWLESALNRPESPRSTRPPSQPSWARDRQSRGSVDMGRVSNFKEVTPIGLMRTPPPGLQFKRPSVSGPSLPESPGNKAKEAVPESPSVLGTPVASKVKETIPETPSAPEVPETKAEDTPGSPSVLETSDTSMANQTIPHSPSAGSSGPVKSREAAPERPSPPAETPSTPVKETTEELKSVSLAEQKGESQEPAAEASAEPTRRLPPSSLSPKPNFSISTSSREPISPKPKQPQSPVVDFRANLRKREVVKDSGPEKEPEFKNVFGRLKKTETRNYVAPDELTGNILRGKAALNVTGGPKKTQRVDEFKDSLVKRKDEMKAGGGSIRRNTVGEKDAPPKPTDAVPEAIAVRQSMTRSKSSKRVSVDEPISPSQSIGSSRASQDRQSFSPFPTSPSKDISSSRTSQERQPWPPSPANDDSAWPLKQTGASPVSQEAQPLSLFPADDSAEEKGMEKVTPATDSFQDTSTLEPSLSQEQDRAMVGQNEPSITKAQDAPTEHISLVRNLPPVPIGQATVNPSLAGKGKLAGRINPALAGLLSRGPPMATEGPKKDLPTPVSTEIDSASPSAPLTHVTKGRARGPKRRLPKATTASTPFPRDDFEVGAISYFEAIPSQAPPIPVESSDDTSDRLLQPDSDLIPDTEFPRSGSPVSTQLPVNSPLQELLESESTPPVPAASSDDMSNRLSLPDSASLSDTEFPRSGSPITTQPPVNIALPDTDTLENKGAPSIPVESADNVSDHISQPDSDLLSNTENAPSVSPVTTQSPVNIPLQSSLEGEPEQRPQPRPLTTDFDIFPSPGSSPSLETAPRALDSPGGMSATDRPPVPPKSSPPTSPLPSTPKSLWGQQNRFASSSPSPLRTSYKENRMDTPPTPPQKNIPGVTVAVARDSVSRATSEPSPPVPPKRDDYMLHKPIDPRRLSRKMSAPSLVAQASEAREVIAGFFKAFPNPRDRMDIDPQLMLMKKPEDFKIRTLKLQIWELTGDGRRQELPSHQEYILYQGSMYLCVHLFEAQGSSSSEVYLWCGDDVPDASVDNEQMFARKVARENSSKVQVIRQGKEPVRFIQALGGIMITRRGSSSRHNSSALYMLCGRKHLGQMTFDEIDYSLRNLCSGFPYVVSAPFGKLYLWKGKGSGPEETGAARLIGMDLGLTGEFEEVAEGEEPEEFFDVFAGPREAAPYMCQDYWQLKPKYSQFRTRLLRVDHELGQPTRFWNLRRPGSGSPVVKPNDCVQEIEPFCYRDLTEKDIYVLDTFFEIYVIIGEQASQKSADFASAVVFAHEYGILATSLQDRPFIPKSFVALGGVADRCQSAFRKWNPRTLNAPFVFPLDVVIEAMRAPGEE